MNKPRNSNSTRFDAYQHVTDAIISALEAGTVPWAKPWRTRFGGALPQNLVSRRPYSGINTILLSLSPFNDPRWLTFNQAKARGGSIRKGERGSKVVFWKVLEYTAAESRSGQDVTIPFLQAYTVFNFEQTEGLSAPTLPGADDSTEAVFAPTVDASGVYDSMPGRPELKTGFDRAAYSPSRDLVMMPKPEQFINSDDYFRILFHELIHSTGHESRLNREGVQGLAAFGSPVYSREELVAELGAAMVTDAAGVPPAIGQNAAYIEGWLKALRGDNKLIVRAASQAQKAADYILGEAGA